MTITCFCMVGQCVSHFHEMNTGQLILKLVKKLQINPLSQNDAF